MLSITTDLSNYHLPKTLTKAMEKEFFINTSALDKAKELARASLFRAVSNFKPEDYNTAKFDTAAQYIYDISEGIDIDINIDPDKEIVNFDVGENLIESVKIAKSKARNYTIFTITAVGLYAAFVYFTPYVNRINHMLSFIPFLYLYTFFNSCMSKWAGSIAVFNAYKAMVKLEALAGTDGNIQLGDIELSAFEIDRSRAPKELVDLMDRVKEELEKDEESE